MQLIYSHASLQRFNYSGVLELKYSVYIFPSCADEFTEVLAVYQTKQNNLDILKKMSLYRINLQLL